MVPWLHRCGMRPTRLLPTRLIATRLIATRLMMAPCAAALLAGGARGQDTPPPPENPVRPTFVCPPCGVDCHDKAYPRPGSCPQCGMKLVPSIAVPHVAVLVFERADLLTLAGPAGVLQSSNAAHVYTVADTREPLRVQDFQTLVPQHDFQSAPRVDVLVIPGGHGAAQAAGDETVLGWVRRTAQGARCVLAVETGVLLLARAGVLGTETVVADARLAAELAKSAPDAKVRSDLTLAESGRIFTAANGTAAQQQALHIVHALKDEKRAQKVAQHLGIDWQPRPDRGRLPPARPVRHPRREPVRAPAPAPTPAAGSGTKAGAERPTGRDWSCWRGPAADGVSPESAWLDQGTPLWRVEAGLGHSCPVVVGDRVVVVGFDEPGARDVVRCLDAGTGAEVWSHGFKAELDARGHGGGTLTTPAVRDGRVYLTHRRGAVRCLDAGDGKLIWHKAVAADLSLEGTEYGFGASPVLVGDLLVYAVAAVVALDAKSGTVRWQTRDLKAMYSTPTAFPQAGATRLAAFTKEGLYVLDAATGKELAFHPFRKGRTTVNAASPVVAGDRVFISSGYDHGCALLRFDGEGLHELWSSRVMRTRLSGCVRSGEHLYGFDETTLKCIGLDGEERWRRRGFGMGALSVAGDRLLVLGARGDLVVADAAPVYRERSRRKVFDEGTCWTSPVVAHGRVYCRNSRGTLVCFDHGPR